MVAASGPGGAALSWNVASDLRQVLAFHFMVNALRAGTIVAVAAAVIGWFMVLRRQSFAGHTLAVVAFPGAAGAIWLGVPAAFGYFGFSIAAALTIAAAGGISRGGEGFTEESAVTGTVQAFALACGFLFVTLYGGFLGGLTDLLFGTFLGITDTQVLSLLVLTIVALALLAITGRSLFFATIDPAVAAARGVPVAVLSVLFLVVLAVAAAEVSQITGALLVFALLVMPAAAAQQLTARPSLSLAITVVIALAVTWLGLGVAYFSVYPVGFFVTTFGFTAYVAAVIVRRGVDRLGGHTKSPSLVVAQ
ncbi:MAG TPA: metal ABC transporter permease [Acidimicrobiales bacterium]|nr:metal ABC transporter permease [Acidimicrobiales bacterium]